MAEAQYRSLQEAKDSFTQIDMVTQGGDEGVEDVEEIADEIEEMAVEEVGDQQGSASHVLLTLGSGYLSVSAAEAI